MANASTEVVWVICLLEELDLTNLKPVTLHCDNISTLHIAQNSVYHERTKHIEVDYHFTREKSSGRSSTIDLSSYYFSACRCLY